MGSFEQAMLNTAFGMNDTYAKALASYLFREVIEDAHVKYNISQADMNLYEIYFILKWHPPLNVDDKTRDFPTVDLPPVEWREFSTKLWDKWVDELQRKATDREKALRRYHQIPEEIRVLRSANKTGELSDEEFWDRKEALVKELDGLNQAIWGR